MSKETFMLKANLIKLLLGRVKYNWLCTDGFVGIDISECYVTKDFIDMVHEIKPIMSVYHWKTYLILILDIEGYESKSYEDCLNGVNGYSSIDGETNITPGLTKEHQSYA